MSVSLRSKSVLHISATVLLVAVAALGAVRTTAGIQGSGIRMFAAVGPITAAGSGSVVVGGVEYSTAGAQVDVDGAPGMQSQLHVGDVVSIGGTDFGRGPRHDQTATSVAFSGNVRGAVSGVDVPSSTFFVLGQTVHVTPTTAFDPSLQSAGLQGLQNGAELEVSGFSDAAGNIVATRVGTAGGSAVARVTGAVRDLNPTQMTFSINSLIVSYADAVVTGTLSEGAQVAVQGLQPAGPNGTLSAARVDLVIALQAHAGAEGRIEGLITDFPSANYFEVNGQPVTVDSHTHLHLHAPLGLDVSVKVTGRFDSTGSLVAKQVQTQNEKE
jgi:hypothetical protein